MINLFGKWVNPANICYIEDAAHSAIIYFTGACLELRGKSAEDVAKELRRITYQPIMDGIDSKIALMDSVRSASIPLHDKPVKGKK